MAFDSGVTRTRLSGGPASYYLEYTTTNLYVEKALGGNVNEITVTNDSSTDTVQVSFDGSTLESDIKAGETGNLRCSTKTSVYIKATAGGDTCRIWAW